MISRDHPVAPSASSLSNMRRTSSLPRRRLSRACDHPPPGWWPAPPELLHGSLLHIPGRPVALVGLPTDRTDTPLTEGTPTAPAPDPWPLWQPATRRHIGRMKRVRHPRSLPLPRLIARRCPHSLVLKDPGRRQIAPLLQVVLANSARVRSELSQTTRCPEECAPPDRRRKRGARAAP